MLMFYFECDSVLWRIVNILFLVANAVWQFANGKEVGEKKKAVLIDEIHFDRFKFNENVCILIIENGTGSGISNSS